MIRFAYAAAAVSLAAAVALSPASARDGSWQVGNDQFHLVYGNIDPGSANGRAALLARVERAAGKLCASERVELSRRDCIRETVAATAAQPRNGALRLALAEAQGTRLAAR